jgi:hypothetical protein
MEPLRVSSHNSVVAPIPAQLARKRWVRGAGTELWRPVSTWIVESQVVDLVDIALPANAQAAAEALGLTVEYNITKGAWVRQIPRDEAEIAIECLGDWGIAARIREGAAPTQPADARGQQSAVVSHRS